MSHSYREGSPSRFELWSRKRGSKGPFTPSVGPFLTYREAEQSLASPSVVHHADEFRLVEIGDVVAALGAGLAEGADRATLERNVADVAWEVRWLRARVAFLLGLAETLEKDALEAHYAHQDDTAYLCRSSATQKRNEARGHQAKRDDCEAWLVRARAGLAGSEPPGPAPVVSPELTIRESGHVGGWSVATVRPDRSTRNMPDAVRFVLAFSRRSTPAATGRVWDAVNVTFLDDDTLTAQLTRQIAGGSVLLSSTEVRDIVRWLETEP